MTDLKTTQEISRTVDGTEYVRLATAGANWKATLSSIFSALGGGSAASPVNSIQFNNPLGTFDGDADLTWISGTGLTAKKHAAFGNYADVDTAVYAAGDPTNAFTYSIPGVLNINEYRSGDLSLITDGISDFTSYTSYKHTGSSNANFCGVDIEVVRNSDSTGPFHSFMGAYFGNNIYGSGDIDHARGLTAAIFLNGSGDINSFARGAYHIVQVSGSNSADQIIGSANEVFLQAGATGTINYLTGGSYQVQVDGPFTVGLMTGLMPRVVASDGTIADCATCRIISPVFSNTAAITDYHGLIIEQRNPGAVGATITNAYGLRIQDHGNFDATTRTYNLISEGTSFITPSDTSGGNLFQGHVAIGNYADVDKIVFPPTSGGTVYTSSFPLIVSEKLVGDLSDTAIFGYNPQLITGWGSYKHTGTSVNSVAGIDVEIFVLSDSTGPFYQTAGLQFVGDNRGSGDLSATLGANMTCKHSGSGTIGFFTGIYLDLWRQSGGPVTDSYGIYIDSPFVTGAAAAWNTNCGLFVADQSGIGSVESLNIKSLGTGSLTYFEGKHYQGNYYETTEITAPAAPPANGVRIYAQDNGAGKTQLMALFNTGAAQQIAIQP